MKILVNEQLCNYTTLRLGGTAETMYIPECVEDLIDICQKQKFKYIIGGGSNLLIGNGTYKQVLNLREFSKEIEQCGDIYTVGASVQLSTLIQSINQKGYGGIEYLCTVPGLVGGACTMNAGTGIDEGKAISDYIISVTALNLENGKLEVFDKRSCKFSFRNSVFKNNLNYIIVKVQFKFAKQSIKESQFLCEAKREFCRTKQDCSAPNVGSVFSVCDSIIMTAVCYIGMGNKKGVHFSRKTKNWIINNGSKDSNEALQLIEKVQNIHKILHRRCRCEVIVWN